MQQGILSFSNVLEALDRGLRAFRTPWASTGQMIRKASDASPGQFILVKIDGTETPWAKPAEDLEAKDWIIRS